MNYKIDNLQYCKWSREVFKINREAGLDAVHVTVVYHEDYDEFLARVKEWDKHFQENSDLIFLGKSHEDIERLSLIHICRCRGLLKCRARWSPYH